MSQENDFKVFFIDMIDDIMRGLKIWHCSVLLVTVKQLIVFIIKMNKAVCLNDAFEIKHFESEQLEKLASYYGEFVN